MRCDYRILKKKETDVLSIVQDTIAPLAPDVQEFILHLHKRYLGKGLSCVVEVKGFRGIPIVLDDSVLEIKNQIETWLDQEVS